MVSAGVTARRMFLPLAWTLGALFALVTPPFQVPDEFAHFYRAYQVSEGQLAAYRQWDDVGGDLPVSLDTFGSRVWGNRPFDPKLRADIRDIWAARAIPLQSDQRQFFGFATIARHSPMNYVPQAAPMALARVLSMGPMGMFYGGRMANLLIWSLLVYFSLRLIPVLDWTVFLLALTPMSLAQAASLSADATANGVCFLFVAVAVRCAMTAGAISRTELAGLTLGGAAVALAKGAYLPLTLLFLLIPAGRFANRRHYWLAFAIFVLVALAAFAGWSLCTFSPDSIGNPVPGVSPWQQLLHVLHHPFLALYMETRLFWSVPYLSSIIGRLGWNEIKLWYPLTAVYFGVLFYATRRGGRPDRQLTMRQRAILATAVLGCWAAVFTLLYLLFTPVGATNINALQGRYLLPVTLPFFLMCYPAARPRRHEPGAFYALFSSGFAVYALLVLAWRCYGVPIRP